MRFLELPMTDVYSFDYQSIAKQINEDAPDLIWVSLGCPKQEQFMQRLLPYLNLGVMFGSGALFNFYCGLKDVPQRAPQWMVRHVLKCYNFLYVKNLKRMKEALR